MESPGKQVDLKVLSFNVGHSNSKSAQKALVELLQRTKPDVVTLQECPWTVGRNGKAFVLNNILSAAFPGGTWHVQEVTESRSRYNTVLYNADRFDAQHFTFEGLGIDPPDDHEHEQHWYRDLRRVLRLAAAPWLQGRYTLLQLTSRSNPDLWLYLLNWHGPRNGQKDKDRAKHTRQLLGRAALLVNKAGRPIVIAGDFNHPLGQQEVERLWGLNPAQHGISFALHDGEASIMEVAEQRYWKAKPGTEAAEEALRISNCLAYKVVGYEIDRICSMVPTRAARSGDAGGRQPPLALACTEAAATYVTVHARFDHGPRLAKFALSASPEMVPEDDAVDSDVQEVGGDVQPEGPDTPPKTSVRSLLTLGREEVSGEAAEPKGGAGEQVLPGTPEVKAEGQPGPNGEVVLIAARSIPVEAAPFHLLPVRVAGLLAEWRIIDGSNVMQGGRELREGQALLMRLRGKPTAYETVELSTMTAELLLAPVDSTSCSGAAAEVGLVAAGVVYRFAGPAGLPPWAGTLVDSSILWGGRQAGRLCNAAGSKVLVLAHPRGHAASELRLHFLVTPKRLAAELQLARRGRARPSAAQRAAAAAAVKWCSQFAEAEECPGEADDGTQGAGGEQAAPGAAEGGCLAGTLA